MGHGVARAVWISGMILAQVACKPSGAGSDNGPGPSASGAASEGARVFDQMHAAACAEDADKFFAHVSEANVVENWAKSKGLSGSPQAQAMAKSDLNVWHKRYGKACAWVFMRSEVVGDQEHVEIRTGADASATSDTRLLVFGKVDGQLKLVDFQAQSGATSWFAPAEAVDLTVEAAELLRDYKGNELRGDAKYKGKRVRLLGEAGEMKRDLMNAIYMTVGTGAPLEIPTAQCFFGDEYLTTLASLTKGEHVAVNCTVSGLMMNVLLKNCAFSSALDVCFKLHDAGIAKMCPQNGADVKDETANFYTAATPQTKMDPAAVGEFVKRSVGSIELLKDDSSYESYAARRDAALADPTVRESEGPCVGSPVARILVCLPAKAAPDLLSRVKAVVDRLPPAAK
jgi:hypothetical protein